MIKFGFTNQNFVERSVQDFARITGRSLVDEIIALARLAAVQLARRTQPFGDTRAAQQTGETRIGKDINRVFTTAPTVFAQLDEKDPAEANLFWQAYRAQDLGSMAEILQYNNIDLAVAAAPDPALHTAARTKNGGVHKNYRARQLVTHEGKLNAYVAKKKKMSGFAKSGWAKAADACGGHRGIMAWASSRHKGSHGSAQIDRDLFRPKVTLQNHVTYVTDILPEAQQNKAIADAYENSLKRIMLMVKKSLRNFPLGRRAA